MDPKYFLQECSRAAKYFMRKIVSWNIVFGSSHLEKDFEKEVCIHISQYFHLII